MNEREKIKEAFLGFNDQNPNAILCAQDYFEAGYKAALASQAQQPSKNIADALWGNKALMALNADLGLSMDQLVKVANAILQSQAQQEPIGEVQHYATPANLPAYVNVKWYGKPPKNGAKVYALPPAPEGGCK